mgnify:FL=1
MIETVVKYTVIVFVVILATLHIISKETAMSIVDRCEYAYHWLFNENKKEITK